jgi:hypothetical protein
VKRRTSRPHARPHRDVERLAWLARGLADSGSRIEDGYWEREIRSLVDRLLSADGDEALNQTLDVLRDNSSPAYDELADLIEAAVEGVGPVGSGGEGQVLLVAMPVLAWSVYGIPAASLPAAVMAALKVQLAAHVLAAGVEVAMADHLFSPDQLPQGYVATRHLTRSLAEAIQAGSDAHIPARQLSETGQYISDVRYLLAGVRVCQDGPVFRWNEADGNRDEALAQWQAQAGPSLQPLLAGCVLQLLPPDAYFAAWRRADREGRPFSVQASVAYLESMLGVSARDLRAVVAPYYDQRLQEWRIGFAAKDAPTEVMHGIVWPLFGAEEELEAGDEIAGLLKAAGVGEVTLLQQGLPVEYCDDCGVPLFPNVDGESVHAEMPEQDASAPGHLH